MTGMFRDDYGTPTLSIFERNGLTFMKFTTTLTLVMMVGFFASHDLALAIHEIDHRYDIMGYVLDENQVPLANTEVSILLNITSPRSGSRQEVAD